MATSNTILIVHTLTVTEVPGSADPMTNSSKVRILWQSKQDGIYNLYTRTAYYYVRVNDGEAQRFSVSYTLPANTTVDIVDVTITIPHREDGTGTVSVSTWMDTGVGNDRGVPGLIMLDESLDLAMIYKASVMDSLWCTSYYFTGELNFLYTPKTSGYYNQVEISQDVDGAVHEVRKMPLGASSPVQQTGRLTLTAAELEAVYTRIPAGTDGKLRLTLTTWQDAGYTSQAGDSSAMEITLRIPDDDTTKPVAQIRLDPASALEAPFDGLYIRGKTKVQASFLSLTGKYGADIVSCSMRVGGVSYGAPYLSGYLGTAGETAVLCSVTDSRGFCREYSLSVTVLDYAGPRLLPMTGESRVICDRCNASGNPADNGTYICIKAKRSYSHLNHGGVQYNHCSIRYRYRQESNQSFSGWMEILDRTAQSDEISTGPLLGNLSSAATYVFEVQAADDLGEHTETSITVSTEKVFMHRDGARGSLAIGKMAEDDNTVDLAEDKTLKVRGAMVLLGDALQAIRDIAYPVGTAVDLYTTDDPTDLFGGVWVQMDSSAAPYRWKRTQ